MSSSYSFPKYKPAEIVDALHSYGIAPSPNLCAEDVENPRPGFVAEVLELFLANFVWYAPATSCPVSPGSGLISAFACFGVGGHFACCSDEPDEQLQFQALQALDNPEHHMRALALTRIYRRANAFLQSIQFQDLNLRDLLRADGPRVAHILSALINFLHFRQDRLSVLVPVVQEYGALEERQKELRAKIAEVSFPSSFLTFFCLLSREILRFSSFSPPSIFHLIQLQKTKDDHLLKEQMEAPVVHQLEKEVNALKQRLHEYNTEQLSLRAKSKAIDEKKEETLMKVLIPDLRCIFPSF
jgi:kinetochore protein Nuf2